MKEIFLKACQDNELNKVRSLLVFNVDVNWTRDDDGWSGLNSAARRNYGELLELLLAQTEVNVNMRDKYNWTPLMVACDWGHENIVRRLCTVTGWSAFSLQTSLVHHQSVSGFNRSTALVRLTLQWNSEC